MFWYLKYYEKDGKEKFTRGADGFFRVGNITDVDKLNDDYDEQYIKPGNSSVHIRYYKSGLKYPVMEIIGSYPIVYKRWSYEQSSGD